MAEHSGDKIPILLLKTKSTPVDNYEDFFSTFGNHRYAPFFVPVLEHQFDQDVLSRLRQRICDREFVPLEQTSHATYGALIFTSQRAVEAFTQVVEDIRKLGTHPIHELLPQTLPLYVVGPATARGLKALNLPCPIQGEGTGNGEALAAYIVQDYNSIYPNASKPHIMFLVGDKRRDIIPKTLQTEQLGQKRSMVDEVVVYQTGEMLSFKDNFSSLWRHNASRGSKCQWAIVFSPTGCKAMLETLGLLDAETGKVKSAEDSRDVRVATIGPTTRDYLIREFGFSPDVCAETPTPEGVAAAIEAFVEQIVANS